MASLVHIVAVGGITPAGACSAVSGACVRAGLGRAVLHTRVDGTSCHAAFVESLPSELPRVERMRELLRIALEECAQGLAQVTALPVWLAVPSDVDAQALLSVGEQRGSISCASLHPISAGHASGLLAMEQALATLGRGNVDLACVAGVDVRTDEQSLAQLAERDLLLGDEGSSWGIVPSEGAGVLLLASERAMRRLQLTSLGHVRAVASAVETSAQRGVPCIGQALSSACHAVLDTLHTDESIAEIYCDLNGERRRSDDWGYTASRIVRRCRKVSEAVMPALQWGDLGHATGPLLVQLALSTVARGQASGPRALVWCASDEGARAALLVDTAGQARDRICLPAASRAASLHAQDQGIVEQLIDDACFLYEQRARLYAQLELTPVVSRGALEACEKRLERQLDGSFIGHSITLAHESESVGEEGYPYVVVRTALASDSHESLLEYLSALALEQPKVHEAVRVGICHGAGPSAATLAQRLMAAQQPATLRALGLWLAGHVDTAPADGWERLASEGPERLGASFPWTLGRLGSASHVPLLVPWLESDDSELRTAAALAFLRLDRASARRYIRGSLQREGYLLALAIECRPSEHRELTEAARASSAPSSCLALGLLGTLEAVALLRERLDGHPLAAHAANALHLALGNGPIEDVEEVVVVADDELTSLELEQRRAGDQTIGVERERLRRLAQQSAAWEPACVAHARRFQPDQRARLGMPLSLASTMAVLAHTQTPPSTALLCAEDLTAHGGAHLRLPRDPRMVDLQRAGS